MEELKITVFPVHFHNAVAGLNNITGNLDISGLTICDHRKIG